MLRKLYAVCFLFFLPISANALSTSSIGNTNCSGSLTTSLLNGASFACAGNLTLDGGFITSDSLINISADGDLFVDNLTLTAPTVTFTNLSGTLTIGSAVVVNTSGAIIQGSQDSILNWSKFNIPQGSGGAVLVIGDGGDLKVGAGSGYVLNPGNNTPVVGGILTIIGSGIGSGNITTTGSIDNGSLISVMAVPEPSTYAMMLAGILGLASIRRKST